MAMRWREKIVRDRRCEVKAEGGKRGGGEKRGREKGGSEARVRRGGRGDYKPRKTIAASVIE